MALFLLCVDTDLRTAEIPFESQDDLTAIGDVLCHVHRCHLETVSRAALYRLAIGPLDRDTGLFDTRVGECVFDSDHECETVVSASGQAT